MWVGDYGSFATVVSDFAHLFLSVIVSPLSISSINSFQVASFHCSLKPLQCIFLIERCQQGEHQQHRRLSHTGYWVFMGGTGTDLLNGKGRNLTVLYIKDNPMLESVVSYVKDRELFIFKGKGKAINLHTC